MFFYALLFVAPHREGFCMVKIFKKLPSKIFKDYLPKIFKSTKKSINLRISLLFNK